MSDIEIARKANKKSIKEIALTLNLEEKTLHHFGNYTAKIDLKAIDDSFASAANYINKMGWKQNKPCYLEIDLTENVPAYLLNTSAKKIKNKKNI